MEEIKYYCYICDEELTDTNKLLCKRCNNTLGDTADAKLAEDLSFYTDMLKVKKVRKNPHKQIMLDDEGREVAVYNAGEKIELRRPYVDKEENQGNIMMAMGRYTSKLHRH